MDHARYGQCHERHNLVMRGCVGKSGHPRLTETQARAATRPGARTLMLRRPRRRRRGRRPSRSELLHSPGLGLVHVQLLVGGAAAGLLLVVVLQVPARRGLARVEGRAVPGGVLDGREARRLQVAPLQVRAGVVDAGAEREAAAAVLPVAGRHAVVERVVLREAEIELVAGVAVGLECGQVRALVARDRAEAAPEAVPGGQEGRAVPAAVRLHLEVDVLRLQVAPPGGRPGAPGAEREAVAGAALGALLLAEPQVGGRLEAGVERVGGAVLLVRPHGRALVRRDDAGPADGHVRRAGDGRRGGVRRSAVDLRDRRLHLREGVRELALGGRVAPHGVVQGGQRLPRPEQDVAERAPVRLRAVPPDVRVPAEGPLRRDLLRGAGAPPGGALDPHRVAVVQVLRPHHVGVPGVVLDALQHRRRHLREVDQIRADDRLGEHRDEELVVVVHRADQPPAGKGARDRGVAERAVCSYAQAVPQLCVEHLVVGRQARDLHGHRAQHEPLGLAVVELVLPLLRSSGQRVPLVVVECDVVCFLCAAQDGVGRARPDAVREGAHAVAHRHQVGHGDGGALVCRVRRPPVEDIAGVGVEAQQALLDERPHDVARDKLARREDRVGHRVAQPRLDVAAHAVPGAERDH
mmetsp:Transcript_45922/g.129890  ORF Transcript_45922/g.129890 Transcript_45922/m.129890 type:complete len:636 (+) Transcript_45922:219-2126(+)